MKIKAEKRYDKKVAWHFVNYAMESVSQSLTPPTTLKEQPNYLCQIIPVKTKRRLAKIFSYLLFTLARALFNVFDYAEKGSIDSNDIKKALLIVMEQLSVEEKEDAIHHLK